MNFINREQKLIFAAVELVPCTYCRVPVRRGLRRTPWLRAATRHEPAKSHELEGSFTPW